MYSVFNTTEADAFKPPELSEAILAKMVEMREKYLTGPDGPIMTPKPTVVPRGPLQHVYVPPTMATLTGGIVPGRVGSMSTSTSTFTYTPVTMSGMPLATNIPREYTIVNVNVDANTNVGTNSMYKPAPMPANAINGGTGQGIETKKTYMAVDMPGSSAPSLSSALSTTSSAMPSLSLAMLSTIQKPLHVPSHITSAQLSHHIHLPSPMPNASGNASYTRVYETVDTMPINTGNGRVDITGQATQERKYVVADMPSTAASSAHSRQYQLASMPGANTSANAMDTSTTLANRGVKRPSSEMSNSALTSTGNGQDSETVGKLDDVTAPKDYAHAITSETWPQLSVVTINGIRVAGQMRVIDHRFFKYTMTLTENTSKRPRLDPKAANSWLVSLLNETKYWITKVRHVAVTMAEDAGIASYALAMHEFPNEHATKFDKAMTSLSDYIAVTPVGQLNVVAWLDAERRKGIENEWAHELLSSEVLAGYFTCCDLVGDTATLLDYLPLHVIREMSFDERRVRRAGMKKNPYSIFFPLMHLRTASFADWLQQEHAALQGRAAPMTPASHGKEFKATQKLQGKNEKNENLDKGMDVGNDSDKEDDLDDEKKAKEEQEQDEKDEQDSYEQQKNNLDNRFVIPVTLPRSSLSNLVHLHGSAMEASEHVKFLDLDQFFRATTYEMIAMDQEAGGDTSSELITNTVMIKFRRKGAWQKAMSDCNDLYQEAFLANRDTCKMGSFTGQTLNLRMSGHVADLSPFVMALIKERHLVLYQDESKSHTALAGVSGAARPCAPVYIMVRSAFVFAAEVKNIMKSFINKASRTCPQLKGVLFDPKYFVETDENKDTPAIALARAEYSKLDFDQKRLHNAITWNHPMIVVAGGAGTGKTWSVMRFLIGEREEKGPWTSDEERLDENGDVIPKPPAWSKKSTVLVLTPTNRIARRIQRLFNLDAMTFHNLLKWGLHNDLLDRLEKVRVLVLEELGLVGERMFNMVMRLVPFMPSLERIICSGDHMQLRSVDPGNVVEDLMHCPWIKQIELTENHRSDPDARILAEVCRCIAHKDIMGLPRRAAAFTVGTFNANTTYKDIYNKYGAPSRGATIPDPTQFQILSYSHNVAREANLGFLSAAGKLTPTAAITTATASGSLSISSNTNKYARAASYPAFFYVGEKLGVIGREDRDGVRFDTNQTLVVRRIYDVWPKLEDIQMDCQQTNVPMHSYLGEVASTRMLDLYDPEADETYSVHMSADMCRKMIPGWCQVLHAWQGDQAKHITYILESYATRRHLYTGVSRAQKSAHVISRSALFQEQVWSDMAAIILKPEEPVLTALRTVIGA